jgi:hypothetical protein
VESGAAAGVARRREQTDRRTAGRREAQA